MSEMYHQFRAQLNQFRRVLITTHVRPDGDALGSGAATSLGFRKAGIDSTVLLLSELPAKYGFLFHDAGIAYRELKTEWPADLALDSFDALLVVDTGTWSQLPGLREKIENWPRPKLVLDHHLTQENWANAKLVVTDAAAAGEIVADLLEGWPIELDAGIATALFVAIASDTGWFQFSNTKPRTLRLAARLIEAGANTDKIYQAIYQNERAERVVLQTRAQQSLELLLEGRLAVMSLKASDFNELGATAADSENLINIPLQIRSVQASLLLTEPPDGGAIRVSLRSKGQVDVARLAEQFGGGGHARAAGLRIVGSLHSAREQVVGAMTRALVPDGAGPVRSLQ